MKKTGIGFLCCIVLLSIAGCGKVSDTSDQTLSTNNEIPIDRNANFVEDDIERSEKDDDSLLYSNDISKYQIYTEANSEAALKNLYYTVDDFIKSDSSDAVAKGNIVEIEYVYIDGCTYSKLTVEVEELYKGEASNTITVYEDGGYSRLSDEKEQLEAHTDLSQYTKEEMDNLLIDHKFMGAEHSKIGDTVILFLKSNKGSILGDSFRINCSVFGRYTLCGENYIRPEFLVENDNPEKDSEYTNMDTFEISVPKSVLEDKLSQW